MKRNLNVTTGGNRVSDIPDVGVLGSAVPSSGEYGAGYLYAEVLTYSLSASQVRGRISATTLPAGSWYAWNDSRLQVNSVSAGTYTLTYDFYIDGVLQTPSGTLTYVAGATAPSINTQPSNQTVTAGATATFLVVATGAAPITYQWQRNPGGNTSFANISGANSASYVTPATTVTGGSANNADTYRCVVSNGAGSTNSVVATLTVNAGSTIPSFSTQPTSQSVAAGATATFSVVATGTAPITYQWQRNPGGNTSFANISSATSTSYTTPITTVTGGSANSGDTYRCVATNAAGSTNSNAATLTVTASATIPSFSTQPTNQTVTVGSTATFLSGATGTAPITYQWQRNPGGNTSFANISGAVSSNYTTPATTLTGGSANNTDTYRCVATNAAGSTNSNIATLTVTSASLGSVTTDPLENLSGSLFYTTAVKWTWWANGRLGALSGITPQEGTGTTGSNAALTLNSLPVGPGLLMVTVWGSDRTQDAVHLQYLTAA